MLATTLGHYLFILFPAGILAGITSSAAGLASLVSYPLLLAGRYASSLCQYHKHCRTYIYRSGSPEYLQDVNYAAMAANFSDCCRLPCFFQSAAHGHCRRRDGTCHCFIHPDLFLVKLSAIKCMSDMIFSTRVYVKVYSHLLTAA
jgi:hypothetical protein